MALTGTEIDRSSLIPLFYQLKTALLKQIKNNEYPIGSLIPTESEISSIFQISRTTVRQAISELVKEGWVYRVKGKGTYVSKPKIQQSFIKKLESFNDQIERLGMVPSTEVLDFAVIKPDDKVMKALNLKPNEKVIYLHRIRMANNEPIVTIKTFLPYNLCKFILNYDFKSERLYKVLGLNNTTEIFSVERTVKAVEAIKEDVDFLKIKLKKPIQYFESIGYNANSMPIEFSIARYRGDRNKFEVTVFPK